MKKINLKTVALVAFSVGIGVVLDRLIKNIPYFSFDGEVNALDLLNLIVTIVIAFLIPFSVSKILEDQRGVKTSVIDDLKDLLGIVREVKKSISDAYSSGTISASNKDAIYYVFFEAELRTGSIQAQLKESFPQKANELNKQLQDALFEFDHVITGGVLAQSTFTVVDDNFRRQSDTAHSKLETQIKTIIHKVHKA